MELPSHLAFGQLAGKTVHLGVTGSVAAFKAIELLRLLLDSNLQVTACLTSSGARFVTPLSLSALGAQVVDSEMFDSRGDQYAHLRPGMEADSFIIAPATANMLAKAAHGLADDILSCQVLSYPRPVIFAPAMNSRMLESPATRDNITTLRSRGHVVLETASGMLACGEEGSGRLVDVKELYLAVMRILCPQDLAGRSILVTLGRTEEPWDSVRRWTNPSSGLMGAALAVAAWLRGAEVHAVCGPHDLYLPAAMQRHDIGTAQELHDCCHDLWPSMDTACCVAAVCDFKPKPYGEGKFKKQSARDGLSIDFLPNPDTLASLGARKGDKQTLIGFAAESTDLDAHLATKLERKNADIMVGNIVGQPGSGFRSTSNLVTVLDRTGRKESWPLLSKTEIAWRVWDWLAALS